MTERNRDGRPAKGRRLIIGAACLGLLMLAAVCFVCLNTNTSSADPDSGTWGENELTWTFDGDHTLTISGTGNMQKPEGSMPWDEYSESITSVVIEPGVTSVCDHAFDSYDITELTIPSSVNTIGSYAFYSCDVTTLVLPEGLRFVGDYAFAYGKYTALNLPDSLLTVGEHAFAYAPYISLTIGEQLTTIGHNAFSAEDLAAITVDEDNGNFKSVDNVLYNKSGSKLLLYPEGLSSASFTFPDGVTELANTIDNDHLTGINISADLETLCDHPFECRTNLTMTVDSGNEHFKMEGDCLMSKDGTVLIRHNANVASFAVPDGVVEISPYAFINQQSMETVTFPGSLETIGEYAFWYCRALTTVSGGTGLVDIGACAFGQCPYLAGFVFGDEMASIGEYAFSDTRLTSVVIAGSDDASIGECAFSYCYNMQTITLTGGFEIGERAFKDCGKELGDGVYVSLTLGDGIRSIGNDAFYGVKITSVSVPDSVTTIGDYGFYYCEYLTTVTIGTGVTSIGSYTFSDCNISTLNFNAVNCSNMGSGTIKWDGEAEEISLILGNGVQRIPSYMVYKNSSQGYTNLKTLTIPNSVTRVGQFAFYKCSGITDFSMSSNIEYIGDSAFYYCSGITELSLPASLTYIGHSAFEGCSGLETVAYDPANCTLGGRTFYDAGDSEGMEVTFGDTVRTIPDSLFSSSNIGSDVVIPHGVVSIGDGAFSSCLKMTSITIPDTVTTLGSVIVSNSNNLTTVNYNAANCTSTPYYSSPFTNSGADDPGIVFNIGDSVVSIPAYLLMDVVRVKTLNIGANVTTIGSLAFRGLGITTVTIPSKVTSMDSSAFNNCQSLAVINYNAAECDTVSNSPFSSQDGAADLSMVIGNDVLTIPGALMKNCSNLVSLTIGSKVTTIGDWAFGGCTGLTTVTIPASVTTIGVSAFYGCTGLTGLVYGATECTTVGSNAFNGIGSADPGITLSVSEGVLTIPYRLFSGVTTIKSVSLPSTLTEIAAEAFDGCSGLTSLTIPDAVTTIGGYAFSGAGITSLTIGEKVTEIGSNAFAGCNSLTSVVFNAEACETASSIFTNPNECTDFTLTVGPKVTVIPASMFNGMTRLTGVLTLPASVESVGGDAFRGCTGITAVTFGNGLTSIGNNAFNGCTGVSTITFGTGELTIGNYAFDGCTGVLSVTIPSTVTQIGARAFNGMSGLTEIHYNTNATVLGNSALFDSVGTGCSVTFGDNVTTIPYALFNGSSNLSSVTFGSGLQTIEIQAFNNCSSLTVVDLPEGVRTINGSAFARTDLTTLVIPSTLTTLGGSVFDGMDFQDVDGSYLASNVSSLSGYKFVKTDGYMKKVNTGFHLEMGVADAIGDCLGIEGRAISIDDPECDHYTFAGWYSDEGLQNSYEITNCPGTLVTLYAKWTPDTYTVTFDTNGGTPSVDPVDVTYPNKVSAPNAQISKDGYTFAKWLKGGYEYDFNDTVNANMTLTADWSANQYIVTIDGNGGSDGEVRVTFKSIAIGSFESARTGYTLNGYYSAAEDGVKVMNTDCTLIANVDGFTDEEGKWIKASDTALYAQWAPRTFDLTLDKNEGAANGSVTVTFDGGTSSFVAATKAGYHSVGYYTSANAGMKLINGDGSLVDSASGYVQAGKWIATDSPALYARWEADTISIVLDGNGSGSTDGTATVTFDGNDLSVTLAAVRPGWDLTGYFTASSEGTKVIDTDGSVASNVASITDADGNWIDATNPKTLYAQWSPHQYTIVVTGGTSNGTATIRTGDTELSDVVYPENYGYSIAGIFDSEDLQILDKYMSLLPSKASYTDAGFHWIYTGEDTITLHATWKPVSGPLILYGGDVQKTATVTYMSADVVYSAAEKTGYTLLGYYINADVMLLTADGHLVPNITGYTDEEGRWLISGGTSLASKWSPNEYDITLNKNGGTANGSATATFDSSTLKDFVTVSRTGYELTGFFTAAEDGIKVINADGTLVVSAENHTGVGGIWAKTSDTTLYAQWQAKTYTIILDSNGGTSNGSATATYDAGLSALTPATYTGYSLTGYYADSACTLKVAEPAGYLILNVSGYTNTYCKWIRDENTRLYAGWTANEYTVTYNANGGEVDPASETFTYGSSYELAEPTHETKFFGGWKDAQGNIVSQQGIWATADNVALTAQWNDVVTYEVRFAGSEGSQGQAFSRYETSGEIIQLPACSFTKTGHDFTKWSDGVNMYDAGANYTVTADVTFTALWAPQSFWVTYLLNGNALGDEYQAVKHDYGTQVTVLPTFPYTGYDVTAWVTEDAAVSEGKFTMPAADVTFRATATAKTYALTLDKNGGTANGSATVTFDSSSVTSFVTVERTGHTLTGFFTAASEGIKVMNADGTLVNADGYVTEGKWARAEAVELFAQWTVNTYSVTIYGQGGTPDTKSIVLTYGSSEVSGYQAFTRDGYDLKGYYNSDDVDTGAKIIDSSGQLVKNLPQYTDEDGKWICTRNISLYAYWDVKTYDINVDNAGGQGSAKFTIVFGTSTVVGYAAPTMTGYTFAGYFTAANDGVKVIDADGTLVNATGYVTDGKWSKASDTTLYAQWQANTYGMSLENNGGAVNGHVTATYGSSALTNLEDATRYGYGVSGYYTAAEGGVAIIIDGKLQKDTAYTDADGNWNVDDYAILYAHWEPNQYIVTLNSNNGYSDGEAKIAFGTKEFLWFTHASGNTGYHIDGYFTQADGGQLVISVAQLLQSNVDGFTDADGNWALADNATLYAHWSPNVDGIDLNSNLGDHDGHASVKYDATAPYYLTHATRTGYSVEGYYTTVEFLEKVMNADGSFVPNAEGFTDNLGRWHAQGDQMLYARWIPNTYTVTFVNAEGNAVESMQVTYGAAYQLPVPVHNQPEDHFFETWKDSGTQMPISGTWTIAGDVELTAYWSDVAYYDVTYTGGEGGTGEGPGPARVRDGDSITLPTVTFSRTGYAPMGWKEKNSELIREAGASYTVHGDVEFVAMWSIKEYQVQYFIGAGMVYSLTETHNYGDEVTVASYSKPGYDLTPWASEEVAPVDGKFSMPDCYVYFRCTETIHNYQLTLDRNGGTSDGSANITYMQSVGGSLVSPIWEGHHITGYYSAAEGGVLVMQPSCALAQSAEGYTNEESRWIRAEDATLYAHWELDDCQILVDYVFSYGGTAAPTLDKTVKYGTQYSERSPDVVGHTPDVAVVEGTAGLLNVHVTVTYSPNHYTISFDSQGGTPVANITADYGSAIQAPADPTREGFAFGGWLRGSSPYLIPVTMPAENVNLTAQWVKVETSGSSVKVSADSETVVIGMDVAPIASAVNDASTTEVSVAGNGWTMDIPKEIISGATGPVSAGAKTLSENDVASLPAEVQSLVQGKAVFTLSLSDSNGAISFTGKAIKVSLPYKLQDGEKASNVKVFYIDGNNQAVEVDAEYDEQTQCAVFSTDHFSTWYVDATASDSGSGGGSNVGLIIGIVVGILVVVAVVAVVVLVKTGKIGGAKGSA